MFEKKNCEIQSTTSEVGYSVCSKMSVVDDTKSDMEYNCSKCTDR
ncbi:MAG: hypothetical protein K0R50_4240 [Eubacterium sp.]|jgi:hypothetical protein|nr:hypothetical protein [Eubacterium sp.]